MESRTTKHTTTATEQVHTAGPGAHPLPDDSHERSLIGHLGLTVHPARQPLLPSVPSLSAAILS